MNLNINDFSGPLDVLLHMVKKHEMDIYNIDIKLIIDEYISFINSLEKEDLDSKSEYLIMASELIHLKSKLLLGFDDEEEDSDFEINSEEDLKNRLLEYEKYQNISQTLKDFEENRLDYFTKIPENINEFAENNNDNQNKVSIESLIEAFLDMQQRMEYKKPQNTRITHKEKSVNEKITYIKSYLKEKKKVEFTSLFEEYSKKELVITLLSILEMVKNHEVILKQSKNFSKIYVEVLDE